MFILFRFCGENYLKILNIIKIDYIINVLIMIYFKLKLTFTCAFFTAYTMLLGEYSFKY